MAAAARRMAGGSRVRPAEGRARSPLHQTVLRLHVLHRGGGLHNGRFRGGRGYRRKYGAHASLCMHNACIFMKRACAVHAVARCSWAVGRGLDMPEVSVSRHSGFRHKTTTRRRSDIIEVWQMQYLVQREWRILQELPKSAAQGGLHAFLWRRESLEASAAQEGAEARRSTQGHLDDRALRRHRHFLPLAPLQALPRSLEPLCCRRSSNRSGKKA